MNPEFDPIDRNFLTLPSLELAQRLIGHYVVHQIDEQHLVGRIVETEAYQGPEDRAAHSYNNRRTKRTDIMFGPPGFAYLYQMHTHTLLNIVSGSTNTPHAILIRAVEPIIGLEKMRENRSNLRRDINLTNGPGKLCKALQITMDYYGHFLANPPLYIAEGKEVLPKNIQNGPRVGIRNTGEAANYPWRFWEKDNPYVSKYR